MHALTRLQEKIPLLKNCRTVPEISHTQNDKPLPPLSEGDIYICYGLSKKAYLLLETQLRGPETKLIFLEDSLDEILLFCNDAAALSIIEHPQVEIHYTPQALDCEDQFRALLWQHILKKVSFLTTKERPFAENLFNYLREGVHFTFSDYGDLGKRVLQNVVQNLSSLSEVRLLEDAKDALKGVPAFVVGAGPSLDRDYHLLNRHKGVIFAGGSTLAILKKKQIRPHFAATIDKEAPHHIFTQADLQDPYFLFQLRANPDNVRLGKTPPILASSNGGYPLEDFLTTRCALPLVPRDYGWNVSTFLCVVAEYMGCSPIILVGQDLCHDSAKAYAENLSVSKEKPSLQKTKNAEGKEVMTQRDWLFARDWFCHYAQERPGLVQKTTSKGLAFPGIAPYENLEPYPESIDDLVRDAIEALPRYPILAQDHGLRKSVARCETFVGRAMPLLEKLYEEGRSLPSDFFSPLQEEIFYQLHVENMWHLFSPLILAQGDRKEHTQALQHLLFVEELTRTIFLKESLSF
ncbi:MAG: 6-hydroxymethylpterin diphosphokinase MptE-like protein [Chlamydiota bacterium]